jgi:mRNA-degrading endonuclease RelE of RelBE toxin-antitoxin system
MAPAIFSVFATARFERDYAALLKRHPELREHYAQAVMALKEDPYNRSRRYAIKKLEGIAAGDGQYRFRSGRFRFRYDVAGTLVYLKYCGLRREDTY